MFEYSANLDLSLQPLLKITDQYGSAVYDKPTLNIEEVHTEVTDSQIELINVSLAKITITSVYKPPASEFEWPSLPERCRRPLHLVIGDINSQSTAWG